MPARAVIATGLGLRSAPHRRSLPRGVAAVTTALAVAGGVGVTGAVISLRHLEADPGGYGAPWDAVVLGQTDPFLVAEQDDAALAAVRTIPDLVAAGGMTFGDAQVGDVPLPVVGFWTMAGERRVWPTITAGRAPRGWREIALGPKAMRALHLGIGDRVVVTMPDATPMSLEVVGEALVYDGLQIEPGEGAVVDARWFGGPRRRVPDVIVVDRSGSSRDWSGVEGAGFTVIPPPPPAGVRNLSRIDGAAMASAGLVAGLALAAILHACASLARGERRQLATLRSVGLTRVQVAGALAVGTVTSVAIAVLVGVPAGLALGRWAWLALGRQIGFSSPWSIGWLAVAASALAVVLAAGLCAGLGWLTAHRPAAEGLRTE
jgi:hypothetical protein